MSLGFKIYSYLNGKLLGVDSLGNKYYQEKKNSLKRWVIYAKGFGPDSLPTHFHNWLHNTSNENPEFQNSKDNLTGLVKQRVQKHIVKHKNSSTKGYNSWRPK